MDNSNKTWNNDRDQKEKKMVIKFGGGGIGAVILLGGVLATAAAATAFAARRNRRSSGKDRRSFHRNLPPDNDKLIKPDVKMNSASDDGFVIVDKDFPYSKDKFPQESQNKMFEDEQMEGDVYDDYSKERKNHEQVYIEEEQKQGENVEIMYVHDEKGRGLKEEFEMKLEREEVEGSCRGDEDRIMCEKKCSENVVIEDKDEVKIVNKERENGDEERHMGLNEGMEVKLEGEEVKGFYNGDEKMISEKKCSEIVVIKSGNEEREMGLKEGMGVKLEGEEVEGFCNGDEEMMSEKECSEIVVIESGNVEREWRLHTQIEEIVNEESKMGLKEDIEMKLERGMEGFCSGDEELKSEKKCLKNVVIEDENEEKENELYTKIMDDERESSDEEREIEVKLEEEEMEEFSNGDEEMIGEKKCLEGVVIKDENEKRENGLYIETVNNERETGDEEGEMKVKLEGEEMEEFSNGDEKMMGEKKCLEYVIIEDENDERENGLYTETVDDERQNSDEEREMEVKLEGEDMEEFTDGDEEMTGEKKFLESVVIEDENEERENGLYTGIVDDEKERGDEEREMEVKLEGEEVEEFSDGEEGMMGEKKCLENVVIEDENEERENGLHNEIVADEIESDDEEREMEVKLEGEEVEEFSDGDEEMMGEKKCLESLVIEDEEKLVKKQEKCDEEKQMNEIEEAGEVNGTISIEQSKQEHGYILLETSLNEITNDEAKFDARKNVQEKVHVSLETINEGIDKAKGGMHLSSSEEEEEIVEENSFGSGDSSFGSNSEAVWPTELAKQKLIDYEVGESDDKIIIQDKAVFDNYYMVEIGIKKDDPTHSGRRRVVMATLSLLSSLSCFWFFGLSFVYLCLVVFLTILLSKFMATESSSAKESHQAKN